MHLTNYAINKTSSNYVRNEDLADDSRGSKRTLTSVMRFTLSFPKLFIFFSYN
jgi:hypothetical protein